jgi:hypothetical protein
MAFDQAVPPVLKIRGERYDGDETVVTGTWDFKPMFALELSRWRTEVNVSNPKSLYGGSFKFHFRVEDLNRLEALDRARRKSERP